MFAQLKISWAALKRSRPGHRFQDRYRAGQKAKKTQSALHRTGLVVAGIALTLVGIFFLFFPGPGILFIFLGGGLLGSQSLLIARFLDKNELFWRKLAAPLKRHWKKMGATGKAFTSAVGALCGAAVCYGYYCYLFE